MDPTHRCKVWRPCFPLLHHHHHHHHCHFHSLRFCPHGHHHHHHYHDHLHQFNGHPHVCPNFTSSFPRNPEPSGPVPLPNDLNRWASGCEEAYGFATPMLQEQKHEGLEEEEEDDDDPVFVLTDEWRELFAKSEAKRKLEKKQAKKKGKK